MEKLTRKLLKDRSFPADLKIGQMGDLPVKVLQYGEGGFLRGFCDIFIDDLNAAGLFGGSIAVVQPIDKGRIDDLNAQDGLYTVVLRGLEEGKPAEQKRIVTSVSIGINPYTDHAAYIAQAANPDLRVIISNTTEAGITYSPDDHPDDLPPQSFPGKLTAFLNARFKAFNGDATKGCIIIPCELIEENGSELRRIVLQLAEEWKLSAEFVDWVKTANYFTNTLVDRIITGYPRDNYQEFFNELGYEDKLLDTGEIFHFWVIEAPENIELEALAAELPFEKIGLNVVWTRDCTPYKARKVRILNGAHTMSILAAYLSGKNTVGEMMDCADYRKYLERGLFEEVIPGILKYLPWSDLQSFANSVFDRFSNPTIKHDLLAIALNSQSKYRARVLPSILDYVAEKKELPPLLTFSFAALVAFYRGEINDGNMTGKRNGENYPIKDDRAVLEFYAKAWADHADDLTKLTQTICANFDFWGQDLNKLPNFTKTVVQHIGNILTNGAQAALREVL